MVMRKAFINELIKQSRINKNIYLLVADVGYNLVESFQQEFPERFINVGIAEQSMIGIASGLAMQGKKVFCYSLGNFPTLRCLEQIRNDVCYHNLDVKIVNSGAGLYYGTLGSSHHATEDIAVMRSLPNMTVISPCDPIEARIATNACIAIKLPCYLRLQGSNDKELYKHVVEHVIYSGRTCYGSGDSSLTIIGCGSIMGEVIDAAKIIEKELQRGINCISMPSVKPIDRQIIKAYKNTLIFTVEEHNLSGGLGSAVLEAISDMGLSTRVVRIGLQDKFVKEVGSQEYLRKINGLDAESISNKIKEVINV
jgi:transketolase